jgi:uncharacterized membrane protein YhaH (DUF805 family)
MFTLCNILALFAAMIVDHLLGTTFKIGEIALPYGWICILYILVTFIPLLAVAVRRLHDVGKSGWFYLISVIPLIGGIWLLVLFCTEGDKGDNKYGPDPKAVPEMNTATTM